MNAPANAPYRQFLNGMRSLVVGPAARVPDRLPARGAHHQTWPFGLTRLGAGAIGQWFLTVAVAMGWSAREGDWVRIRLLAPFYPLYFLFALIAVARTSGDLAEGASGWGFVAALAVSLVLFAATMWDEERRYRGSPAAVRPA